jgi:hypothetical protein
VASQQPIFDNPTVGAALDRPNCESGQLRRRREPLPSSIPVVPETEPQAARHRDNSHVFWILSVTTLRTIDLGGKKIFDPLFSRFCAEMRVFFERNLAP